MYIYQFHSDEKCRYSGGADRALEFCGASPDDSNEGQGCLPEPVPINCFACLLASASILSKHMLYETN